MSAPAIGPDGLFHGYASLFGRVDLSRDVVEPGAFRRAIARRGPAGIRLLWQHDPKEPIGVFLDIAEDTRGLRVTGRLLPGIARAREAFALLEARAIDGLSIGYRTADAVRDRAAGIRRLREVDLWEVSLVTFPMLPGARVSG